MPNLKKMSLDNILKEILELSNTDNCFSAEDMQQNLDKINDIIKIEFPQIK